MALISDRHCLIAIKASLYSHSATPKSDVLCDDTDLSTVVECIGKALILSPSTVARVGVDVWFIMTSVGCWFQYIATMAIAMQQQNKIKFLALFVPLWQGVQMKLKKYIAETTILAFAKSMAISHSYASRLVNGKRKISGERAIEIEKATGGKVSREDVRPDLYSTTK